jgi:phosphocarrier protein
MVSRDVQVNTTAKSNEMPALIVQLASRFDSDISIESDNRRASAKSLLSMMYLVQHIGETGDTQVTISARGKDEEEAVNRLEAYFDGTQGA